MRTFKRRCRQPRTAVVVGVVLAALIVPFPAAGQARKMGEMPGMKAMGGEKRAGGMSGMSAVPANVPNAPPVKGYAEGERIFFIHTEASDAQVAQMLTDMMGGSPVLVVPALSMAPEAMVASVYVFRNGLKKGDGPFGYTADVFDKPPGHEGYSPLRRINLVYWNDEAAARELKSSDEVMAALHAGEIRIERPGVVVNMPMLTWPGGKR